MERVTKTFFDPLATSKERIREILKDLPVGSAHPFSAGKVLLCRTANGIEEIDISSYPEHYFFNAVDLGEMGEVLQRRMDNFQTYLRESSASASALVATCLLSGKANRENRGVQRLSDITGPSCHF